MDKNKINLAMAKLDGVELPATSKWVGVDIVGIIGTRYGNLFQVPDYADDLNAVHRVLLTLNIDELESVQTHLERMFYGYESPMPFIGANAAQQTAAILKATGNFKEGGE